MYLNSFKNLLNIGRGRYSSIYKAEDIKNNAIVALKEIHKNYFDEPDYALKCAKREIKITQELQSQNVVKLYKTIETKEEIVLVLELCDMTLDSLIGDLNPFHDLYLFQQFVIKLNNALKIMYKKKIMHRDIKPENIFIKVENGEYIPKLADFGISRFYHEEKDYNVNFIGDDQRWTGSVGTYYYIAPEILKSEPYNYKCDLFSLGVTLYIAIFHETPYGILGIGAGRYEKVEAIINNADKLHLIKSGIQSLDDLFEKLLELDPNNRITFEDYFKHKFFFENKEFLQKAKNQEIQPIEKTNMKPIKSPEMAKMNQIKSVAKKFIDIMELPNSIANANQEQIKKITNILYYDENIEKHLDEIHNDSDLFENETNGAFLLCTNLNSLNFTMIDIKEMYDKDHRIIFNLIVTGSKFKKVIDNLINLKCDQYIKNICIYCMNIQKYSHFANEYKKVKGIYNNQANVIKFIHNCSFIGIQPFPLTKILTFHDYKYKYFQRHKNISEFYGDFTEKAFKNANKNLVNFIQEENKDNLKNQNKVGLIESFKTFDLDKDLKVLNNILIKEYTKNTLYGDLNNWLKSLETDVYEKISYYTARLMYSLNNYGSEQKKYFKKNVYLYRGEKKKYTYLLPYERAIGKIIAISSFTSTSQNYTTAENWGGRNKSKNIYTQNRKFSVVYKIKNNCIENSIPCGINIQNISEYYVEEEVLFQPFSFYRVKKVDFNYTNFTVDIELDTIMKKEILEYRIKKGKKVNYDKFQNIVYTED